MNRALFIAVIAAAVLLIPVLSIPADAQAAGPQESLLINIRLDGPDVLGAGVSSNFDLRVSYVYPERISSYGYIATIVGATAGASVTPNNGTGVDGLFNMSIKGSTATGKITVRINATAVEGNITWFRVRDFEFDVVKPVYVDAVLLNLGYSPANNVSINMLVDGQLKDTKYFNIEANSSLSVNFTWVFGTLTQGKHAITLILDNQSKQVEFSRGDNIVTVDVYFSESGNPLRGLMSIMIIFIGVILFFTIMSKGTKKK